MNCLPLVAFHQGGRPPEHLPGYAYGQRYRKIEDQKLWPSFSRNKDFAEGREVTPKDKKSELGDALSKPV